MIVSSLLLSLGLLPEALAGGGVSGIRVIVQSPSKQRVVELDGSYSFAVLTPDADATVARVAAELDRASVPLTERDAWVHGTAALSAAPADGAELTLTVYDAGSAVLDTFTGTWRDGAATLTSTRRDPDGGECASRVGCDGTSDPTTVDLEVLAAVVYPDGAVGLDLAGADALSVAAATLTSIASTATDECVTWSRTGACLAYATVSTRDHAEVAFDTLGVRWDSDPVTLDGAAGLDVRTYDADGGQLDLAKLDIAPAWEDDGEGVSALALDDDPSTSVALAKVCASWNAVDGTCQEASDGLVVVSDGWTRGEDLPATAAIELEDGEAWSVPANSYQVTTVVALGDVDPDTIDGVAVDGVSALVATDRPRRKWFTIEVTRMAVVIQTDGATAWASVTAWSDDPAALPTDAVLSVGGVDTALAFDDEVAVVFAIDTSLPTDPHGLDLAGEVELQGEPGRNGKQKTLARGDFAGRFGVDADGELVLAGIDGTGRPASRGDILIGGEPIDIEREVGDDLVPTLPPAIVRKDGKGTRPVATTTHGKPALL